MAAVDWISEYQWAYLFLDDASRDFIDQSVNQELHNAFKSTCHMYEVLNIEIKYNRSSKETIIKNINSYKESAAELYLRLKAANKIDRKDPTPLILRKTVEKYSHHPLAYDRDFQDKLFASKFKTSIWVSSITQPILKDV